MVLVSTLPLARFVLLSLLVKNAGNSSTAKNLDEQAKTEIQQVACAPHMTGS